MAQLDDKPPIDVPTGYILVWSGRVCPKDLIYDRQSNTWISPTPGQIGKNTKIYYPHVIRWYATGGDNV
jgi:hypothetical protein